MQDTPNRKSAGQYATPRYMVRFILDRVGFTTSDTIFRNIAHATGTHSYYAPRIFFDCCTGAGDFLIEAAHRICHAALGVDCDPSNVEQLATMESERLLLVKNAISNGLWGCELHATPYSQTQHNLLALLMPIIAALQKQGHPIEHTEEHPSPLSIMHRDALTMHNEQLEADYVCANPPYLGEKGNKALFRSVCETIPYWRAYYQGKMDYLYWFIMLGLNQLREGGRLCYITTSYWLTADSATKLRAYILDHAKIIELIDFGTTTIFPDAPGQHNIVFVLERCSHAPTRNQHHPRIVHVKHAVCADATPDARLQQLLEHIQERLECLEHLTQSPEEHAEHSDDAYISVYRSAQPQQALSAASWHFVHPSHTRILDTIAHVPTTLATFCTVMKGVETGANTVTRKHHAALGTNIPTGTGIFILTEAEVQALQLSPHEQQLVRPLVRAEDLGDAIVDISQPCYVLYIDDTVDLNNYPHIAAHVQCFHPVLENRAEFVRNPHRPWFALAWPRNAAMLQAPKLIVSYREKRNNVVYDETGLFGLSGMYFIALKPGVSLSLKYIAALLNSKLLDFWYAHKGKRKGTQREYVERPLHEIPLVDLRGGNIEPPSDQEYQDFTTYLTAEDANAAYALLQQALTNGRTAFIHDALVLLVDQIQALQRQLIPWNSYFRTRLTRLDSDAPLPSFSHNAMRLDDTQKHSVIHTITAIRSRVAMRHMLIDYVVLDLYGITDTHDRNIIL